MFLHLSVILCVCYWGRCLPGRSVYPGVVCPGGGWCLGRHPLQVSRYPQVSRHPQISRHPPRYPVGSARGGGGCLLWWCLPKGRGCLGSHRLQVSRHPALRCKQTPPRDCHCRGRYASYWNAFLFDFLIGLSQCRLDDLIPVFRHFRTLLTVPRKPHSEFSRSE